MDEHTVMRPLERRMLKMASAGADDIEIAWRFRRTPKTVRQVKAVAGLSSSAQRTPGGLRPIERLVVRRRDAGVQVDELAAQFRRRPASIEQIETLARYKLAR
jgi:hypothetical protein